MRPLHDGECLTLFGGLVCPDSFGRLSQEKNNDKRKKGYRFDSNLHCACLNDIFVGSGQAKG